MIQSIRHRGLRDFWQSGSLGGIQAVHARRLQRMLDALDVAKSAEDMNIPGYKFHPLKGNRAGTFAISVSGNWRLTFKWAQGDATDVDYEDYH